MSNYKGYIYAKKRKGVQYFQKLREMLKKQALFLFYGDRSRYGQMQFDLPYILAYKSRNFGQFSPNFLSIWLIRGSPTMMSIFMFKLYFGSSVSIYYF